MPPDVMLPQEMAPVVVSEANVPVPLHATLLVLTAVKVPVAPLIAPVVVTVANVPVPLHATLLALTAVKVPVAPLIAPVVIMVAKLAAAPIVPPCVARLSVFVLPNLSTEKGDPVPLKTW